MQPLSGLAVTSTARRGKGPSRAQRTVLEALASGQYIHDTTFHDRVASLWPPPALGLGTTIPSGTLHVLRRNKWISLTADGMGRNAPKGNLPWYALRYDITPAGRAALGAG